MRPAIGTVLQVGDRYGDQRGANVGRHNGADSINIHNRHRPDRRACFVLTLGGVEHLDPRNWKVF